MTCTAATTLAWLGRDITADKESCSDDERYERVRPQHQDGRELGEDVGVRWEPRLRSAAQVASALKHSASSSVIEGSDPTACARALQPRTVCYRRSPSSRRAARTTASSIITPSSPRHVPIPSAVARSAVATSALASSISAAVGVNTSLATATCAGWIQARLRKPRRLSARVEPVNRSRSAKSFETGPTGGSIPAAAVGEDELRADEEELELAAAALDPELCAEVVLTQLEPTDAGRSGDRADLAHPSGRLDHGHDHQHRPIRLARERRN